MLYRLEEDHAYLEAAESSLSRVVTFLAQQGRALSPLEQVSIHKSLGGLYNALADLAVGTAFYHHVEEAYSHLRTARNEAALMGEEDLVESLQVLFRRARRRFEALTPTVAWASWPCASKRAGHVRPSARFLRRVLCNLTFFIHRSYFLPEELAGV
jgi:hypothetical protein